jgi:DNA (cytosine-5)-methyltransferase 1
MMFRTLDLFSGIGGFSLGLERTGGFKTVAFCEIDPFCRRVLAKHWPEVPRYEDVRELTGARLAADGIAVDVICGGFPCQDVSFAGKRAGLEGARSGLWGEYRRIIGEVRPRFVIVENVPGLLSLGMGTVLGDLSSLGFDAVWDCVPASAIGAPHRRDRVWLVAYSGEDELRQQSGRRSGARWSGSPVIGDNGAEGLAPYANRQSEHAGAINAEVAGAPEPASDTAINGRGSRRARGASALPEKRDATVPNDADTEELFWAEIEGRQPNGIAALVEQWPAWNVGFAGHGGVDDGVPKGLARPSLSAYGNAVVPQIPELIGNAILAANGARE